MTITLRGIADQLGGRLRGDACREISGAAAIDKAGPGDITFAGDEKNLRLLRSCQAGACLVGESLSEHDLLADVPLPLVFVAEPLDAFLSVLRSFRPVRQRPDIGISSSAHVDPTAKIGDGCNVHPGTVVGAEVEIGPRCEIHPGVCIGAGCRIGADCEMHPHVVLYPDVVLGDRVVIHANAVIGADGFGYRLRQGRFEKVPQLGFVLVGNDVEIGACTTIDRGMIGPTVIGEGTKLDNLIMIGHNCELGRHNIFASQVGLAGSVTTGDYVTCAGQAGIKDHVHLGTGCTLGSKAGVHNDIPAGERHMGVPSRPAHEAFQILAAMVKGPELRKQVRRLESRLADLEQLGEFRKAG